MDQIIKKRNLLGMLGLYIITIGLYFFYWLYSTKEEINALGGRIPCFVLAVIPFANIYFDYIYAQEYVRCVKRQNNQSTVIIYFLVLLFLPFAFAFIVQSELNNYVFENQGN